MTANPPSSLRDSYLSRYRRDWPKGRPISMSTTLTLPDSSLTSVRFTLGMNSA
jgi:hypothetical protein